MIYFRLFSMLGYTPERVVCTLPPGYTFDGRSAVIRAQQTDLTRALCSAMMVATNTSICVFNSGAIRIDDQLTGTITQYDILRCLPFAANLITIRTSGTSFTKVLNRGLMNIHNGMFISYAGLEYNAVSETWYLESTRQLVDDANLQLTFVSIPYFFNKTELQQSATLLNTYMPITKAFITYLEHIYKKTRRHTLS